MPGHGMSGPWPNFFVIGAMKCGTSALHTHLAAHPEIFMSEPKEPSHFVHPAALRTLWPEMAHRGFDREDCYRALFEGAAGARIIGESSTNYTKRPRLDGVVERLAGTVPDARFLYLMREPMARTLSHYWHVVRAGREHRPPLEALDADPHYLEVSDYAFQLEPYLARFGRERVLLLTTEALAADPLRTVQTVYRWLGVAPDVVPPEIGRRVGATPPSFRRRRWPLHRLRSLALWYRVRHLVPAGVKAAGRRAYLGEEVTVPAPPPELVAHLRARLAPRIEVLMRLTGRDFPEWEASR
jgi:hypothetical protein